MTVVATKANMRKYYDIVPGRVFAWSPKTHEEFSADPRDLIYSHMDEDTPLLDDQGGEMVLVTRVTQILDVDLLDRL